MGSLDRTPHLIIVPLPAQGHLNGALDLARRLASLDVSITFACTEACIASMEKRGFDAGGLPIRLRGLPNELLPHEESTALQVVDSTDQNDELIRVTESMGPALRKMIKNFEQEGRAVACVVYDLTLWWVASLCKDVRVPAYVFSPFSSSFCVHLAEMPGFLSQARLPLGPNTDLEDKSNIFKIRGLPDLHVSEMPELAWDPNPVVPFEYSIKCATSWRNASGMLLNSVYDLEKDATDRLKEMAPEMDIKGVGPLLPLGFLNGERSSADIGPRERSAAAQKCMGWLDKQPDASVLYVAFGTLSFLSAEQTQELAMGLEACEQRFVWVVRVPESQQQEQQQLLPIGFEERLEGRGVVLWELAPQREMLAHPAIGAFLTHSGWNSTMESVCRGLPMLCWPLFADQIVNAKWTQEVAGAGKILKKTDKGLFTRQEVECMARDILTATTPLRAAAARARDVACHAASHPSGSSFNNLQAFIQMLITHSA